MWELGVLDCLCSLLLHTAVCHARPQEQQAADAAKSVETATDHKFKAEVFQPGPTIDYNPLQKKVIVSAGIDTQAPINSPTGLNATAGAAIPNAGASGLPQTRSISTDDNGQVRTEQQLQYTCAH